MKPARNQTPFFLPALLILAGLVTFNFFWGLGGIGLVERPETRLGEIAREMAVTGDWLVPRINCRPYLTKPVLYHWLAASSLSLIIITLNMNFHYFVPCFDRAASPKTFYRRVASLVPLESLKVSGFPYFGLFFYTGSCLEELSPSQARAYLAESREGYVATFRRSKRAGYLAGFPVVERFVNKEGKELVLLSGPGRAR